MSVNSLTAVEAPSRGRMAPPQARGWGTWPPRGEECDEDIDMLDTLIPWPFSSYKSLSTRSSCSSRIQPTLLHSFGDISLIRRPNEVIFDVLKSWWWDASFGSGPASENSWIILCNHEKVLRHLFWAFSGFVSCRALTPCCGCPPGHPNPSSSLVIKTQ